MNRESLQQLSEQCIKQTITAHLPLGTAIYLFGSRARGTHSWNSDFDILIDADLASQTLSSIKEALDDSFVPYAVDIITAKQCKGLFGEQVRRDAKLWI
jgi:uncharacterized protein